MRKIDVFLIFVLLLEIALVIGVPIFVASGEIGNLGIDLKVGSCKNSVRNSAYIDTLYGYVDTVRTNVNKAESLQFYDIDTLYLVPVGEGKCCVPDYKHGPVYGDDWEFAYVGVTYNGAKYDYYVVSLDDDGCGIDFHSDDDLSKISSDKLVLTKTDISVDLSEFYNDTETDMYGYKKNVKYISDDYLHYFNNWNRPYHLFSENKSISYIAEKADRKSVEIISGCRSGGEYY